MFFVWAVPTFLVFQLFTGSVLCSYTNRKASNGCHRSDHANCDHVFWTGITAYTWQVSYPLVMVFMVCFLFWHTGMQLGRTPTQRKKVSEQNYEARKQWREAQITAAEEEMDRQLYGFRTCKNCRDSLIRKHGTWHSDDDGSNACYKHPADYGGPHIPLDELDVKLERSSNE